MKVLPTNGFIFVKIIVIVRQNFYDGWTLYSSPNDKALPTIPFNLFTLLLLLLKFFVDLKSNSTLLYNKGHNFYFKCFDLKNSQKLITRPILWCIAKVIRKNLSYLEWAEHIEQLKKGTKQPHRKLEGNSLQPNEWHNILFWKMGVKIFFTNRCEILTLRKWKL